MIIENLTEAITQLYPNAVFSCENEDTDTLSSDVVIDIEAVTVIANDITKQQVINAKKAEINVLTEARIFEILKVQNKEKALIIQANMQSEATRIIAEKTIKGRYPAGGEKRLAELGAMQEQVANVIAKGKKSKAKL